MNLILLLTFSNPNQEYLPDNANYVSLEMAEFFSPNGDGINDTWMFLRFNVSP